MAAKLSERAKRKAPPGTAPGTLIPDRPTIPSVFDLFAYGPDEFMEKKDATLKEIQEASRFPVLWVNVNGLGDTAKLQALGDYFKLHPLALEDAVNTHQRPKVDQFENFDFFVVRMANRIDRVDMEQLGLFLGDRFVITFQEFPGDCFDAIRERIRKPAHRLRLQGTDYLAYSLIDAAIDFYFPVLEHYGERLEDLEQTVITRDTVDLPNKIHGVKRDLLLFRRSLWPLRDALNTFLRDPSQRLKPENTVYFRDAYDHTVQLLDLLETYRELSADLLDIYLSAVNNRMNEVMKVLTIISTIFIPMTFIASIYGMNFHILPELSWRYGYLWALGLMAAVALSMILYFRRKGWFK